MNRRKRINLEFNENFQGTKGEHLILSQVGHSENYRLITYSEDKKSIEDIVEFSEYTMGRWLDKTHGLLVVLPEITK